MTGFGEVLRLSGRGARSEGTVRVARVVRTASPAMETQTRRAPIVLQVGTIQVAVTAGFDRQALGEVLDVIAARAGVRK